jgi:hypothetical protein
MHPINTPSGTPSMRKTLAEQRLLRERRVIFGNRIEWRGEEMAWTGGERNPG